RLLTKSLNAAIQLFLSTLASFLEGTAKILQKLPTPTAEIEAKLKAAAADLRSIKLQEIGLEDLLGGGKKRDKGDKARSDVSAAGGQFEQVAETWRRIQAAALKTEGTPAEQKQQKTLDQIDAGIKQMNGSLRDFLAKGGIHLPDEAFGFA